MEPIILWIVLVGSGTCYNQFEHIKYAVKELNTIRRTEVDAWRKAISINDSQPCLGLEVKRLYAYTEPKEERLTQRQQFHMERIVESMREAERLQGGGKGGKP